MKFPSTVISMAVLSAVLSPIVTAQTGAALGTLTNYGNFAAQGSALAFHVNIQAADIAGGRPHVSNALKTICIE